MTKAQSAFLLFFVVLSTPPQSFLLDELTLIRPALNKMFTGMYCRWLDPNINAVSAPVALCSSFAVWVMHFTVKGGVEALKAWNSYKWAISTETDKNYVYMWLYLLQSSSPHCFYLHGHNFVFLLHCYKQYKEAFCVQECLYLCEWSSTTVLGFRKRLFVKRKCRVL